MTDKGETAEHALRGRACFEEGVPSLKGLGGIWCSFPSTHVLGYDCAALRAARMLTSHGTQVVPKEGQSWGTRLHTSHGTQVGPKEGRTWGTVTPQSWDTTWPS